MVRSVKDAVSAQIEQQQGWSSSGEDNDGGPTIRESFGKMKDRSAATSGKQNRSPYHCDMCGG